MIGLLSACFAYAQQTQGSCILKGHVDGLKEYDAVLLDYDKKTEIARAKSVNGDFQIKCSAIPSDGRMFCLWIPQLGNMEPSIQVSYDYIFIDSPEIIIQALVEKDHGLKIKSVKGSPTMDEYERIQEQNPFNQELNTAIGVYNKAFDEYNNVKSTDENLKKLEQVAKKIDEIYAKQAQVYLHMIDSLPESNALAAIIYSYFFQAHVDEQERVITRFSPHMIHNFFIDLMNQNVSNAKKSAVGSESPDLVLETEKGEKKAISSYKGKYILIDFWASWCGPCRKEIPNIKKLYNTYKDKNIEFIGVSIDDDKKSWHKAIQEEKLPYLQLFDAEKKSMTVYSYNGIPFIVLISPDGRILDRNLRGEALAKRLDEILNKTK
ncbi:TlpA family protein disulfide reductase [Porphyromonas pogonae]|nr:TlpA disulfide reductase family protein [Porphyromonas pogonae]